MTHENTVHLGAAHQELGQALVEPGPTKAQESETVGQIVGVLVADGLLEDEGP